MNNLTPALRRIESFHRPGVAILCFLLTGIEFLLLPDWSLRFSYALLGSIALAAQLIGGSRYFRAVLVGGFLAEMLFGGSYIVSIIMAIGTVAGCLAADRLIARGGVFDTRLSCLRDLMRLYLWGAFANAALAALLVSLVLWLADLASSENFTGSFADAWMVSSLAVVLFTPLLLKCWPSESNRYVQPGYQLIRETLIVFALMTLVASMIFLDLLQHSMPDSLLAMLHPNLMFLFLTWIALRLDPRAICFAVLLVAGLGIIGADLGIGYFAGDKGYHHMGSYWSFVMIIALVGMVLSIYIEASNTATQLLAKSEAELSLELKHILSALDRHAMVSVTDLKGNISSVNDNFCKSSGYQRDELLGKNHGLLNSGFHPAAFFREMQDTISSGNVWMGEICNRAKNGSRYWLQMTISPFLDAEGKALSYVAISNDITERIEFEKRLQEQRDFYELISETLGEGLYVQDAVGNCIYLNSEAERLLGWNRQDFLGVLVHDTIHSVTATGEPIAAADCIISRHNRSGMRVNNRDQVFKRREGSLFPVSLVSQGMFKDGRYQGAVVAFQDISVAKRNEQELSHYRNNLEVLVQQKTIDLEQSVALARHALARLDHQKFVLDQHAIVTITDPDDRIIYGNEKFCEISGYSREEFIGQNHRLMNSGQHSREFFKEMYETLNRGEVWRAEVCNRAKDGQLFWLDTTIVSFINEDGKLQERIAVRTDITKRKIAEEEALASSRAKSAFLANMSHELRTPMNGVIGVVDILQRSTLTPEQHRMLNTIQDSSLALLHILNDILDFSKIEASMLEIEIVPTCLRGVAEEVALLLATLSQSKKIELLLFVSPSLPNWILSDPVRLRQIMFNLLGNAMKFTSATEAAPGRVVLSVEPCRQADGSQGLQISVQDNGIGMTAELVAKLFKPFTQGDVSTARKFGGTGLGLSIVQRLVDLMHGEVTVHSILGAGSEFKVILPLHPAQSKAMPVFEPSLEGVHVWCVCRDTLVARIVPAYCTASGAEVTLSGDMAAVCLRLQQPSAGSMVVLLDGDIDESLQNLPEGVGIVRLLQSDGHAVVNTARPEVVIRARPIIYAELIRAIAVASGRLVMTAQQTQVSYRSPLMGKVNAAAPDLDKRQTILLAEDNETNREVIQEQLRMLGYTSDIAGDGIEAFKMWQNGHYALLLTDCHMPNRDGFELATLIRNSEAEGTRLPIIAVTANIVQGEIERCIASGMDDYLSKPLRLDELERILNKWFPQALTQHAQSVIAGELESQQAQDTIAAVKDEIPAIIPLPAIWDASILPQLIGNKPEMIQRMLQKFLLHARDQVSAIAAAPGDTERVMDMAHKLKSAARTVGAMQLGQLCQDMESAGAAGDAHKCAASASLLEETFLAATQKIQEAIAAAPGKLL